MEQLHMFKGEPAAPSPAEPPEDTPSALETEAGPKSAPAVSLLRSLESELLGPSLGNTIRQAFAAMEVAEEEIASAMKRHPTRSDELNGSFRFLRPSEALSRTGDEVYRHHAREILERVASGKDLRPGTDAEMVASLAEITLAAPPSREVTLLYMKLFSRMFPRRAAEFFDGITPDLYEKERMAELEAELRRKLATYRE